MNIAIVTGASSGMGREFVLQLSDYIRPDEIWAIARREDALEKLKSECSIPVRPIALDLCREESFRELEQLLSAEKPHVELLVNAAGFGKFGFYGEIPVEEECRMIDLNCKALLVDDETSPSLHGPGEPHSPAGQPVRLPACALYHHLRRHQGICPELQPGHEPGAAAPGHPLHGHESGVGQNRIFPPCLHHQRGQGAVF